MEGPLKIMNGHRTEKLTLHFDLNHGPLEKEFTLSVLGRKYLLARHDEQTFATHQQNNRALALVAESHKRKVSHFAVDVEMPADAVGIHLVTCASDDPNSLLPDLALAFVHVPTHAKRRHFRPQSTGLGKTESSSVDRAQEQLEEETS